MPLNTLFIGGQHDVEPIMTWVIRINDTDGNYADCAIFASDPTGVATVLGGLQNWLYPVTNEAQINAVNCIMEWT